MDLNWSAASVVAPGIMILFFGSLLQNHATEKQATFIASQVDKSCTLEDRSIHLGRSELVGRLSRDADQIQLTLALLSITPGVLIRIPDSSILTIGIVALVLIMLLAYGGIGRLGPGKYTQYSILGFSLAHWINLGLFLLAFISLLFLPASTGT